MHQKKRNRTAILSKVTSPATVHLKTPMTRIASTLTHAPTTDSQQTVRKDHVSRRKPPRNKKRRLRRLATTHLRLSSARLVMIARTRTGSPARVQRHQHSVTRMDLLRFPTVAAATRKLKILPQIAVQAPLQECPCKLCPSEAHRTRAT